MSELSETETRLRWSNRTSWIAVGAILAVGVAGIAWEHAARYMVRLRYGPDDVRLTEDGTALVHRGEEIKLQYPSELQARLVLEGSRQLRGWFYDPSEVVERGPVLIFVGTVLEGLEWPESPTPELFDQFAESRDVKAFVAGFDFLIDPGSIDWSAQVTIVAIRHGEAYAARLPPLASDTTEGSGAGGIPN